MLVVAAFPPWELGALVWVGFVPWLHAVTRCGSGLAAALQGFWLGLLLGLGGTPWIADAATGYLGLSRAAGLAALGLHACVHQPQLLFAAPALRWLATRWESRRGASSGAVFVVLGAAAYTGLDWAAPKLLRDSVGLALHDHARLSQLAEVGGVYGLTFLVLAVNLAAFSLLRAPRRAPAALAAAGAFLLAAWLYGGARLDAWGDALASPPRSIRVAVVQGNAGGELVHRWASGDAEAARETLTLHRRATDELLARAGAVDLVLWPETAYPGIFRKPESPAQLELNVAFDRYVAARGVPFVFGAYDREDRTDARVLRNGLFFLQPPTTPDPLTPSPMQVHHKSRLFPVGETLPALLDRGRAREWLPGAAFLSAGDAPEVRELGVGREREPLRLGAAICYEDLFAAHTAALARQGAELLVNVSNDSWFGGPAEPRLHLAVARLRSIETRLPQVRATSNGYSALILPTGELRHVSDFGRTEAFAVRVPIVKGRSTAATRWGDWPGPACLLLALLGAVALRR